MVALGIPASSSLGSRSRPPAPAPPTRGCPGARSTCVWVKLQLSLGARGWAVLGLLLLFPLLHLQNGLQQAGEIAQARGDAAESPRQLVMWS